MYIIPPLSFLIVAVTVIPGSGVYLESGKDNDALKQMKALVSLKPKDIALKLKLARLLEKQEKPGEAMKVYKEILDLSPDNEPAGEAYLRLRIQGITANP